MRKLHESATDTTPTRLLLQLRDDGHARVEAQHAGEHGPARRVDGAILREDADARKPVPLARHEIVGVVRRRDLHRAGA